MRDEKGKPVPCTFCHELRYKGRIGVFETLIVNDELRQAVDSSKPLNQAFRKQRGRYLQEEALVLVEKGDTSVQEVLRVLKPAPSGESNPPPAAKAPRTPARNR
jgi:type II secretory ATPase GspE/PulE/Tfp pilus assembly ATPase PilB-like protein